MAEYTFEIPDWSPPKLNKVLSRHWSVGEKLKAQTAVMVACYALKFDVPKASGRRSIKITLSYTRSSWRPDWDAVEKILLDALKRSGLILDDGEKGLVGRAEVEVVKDTKLWTRITLTDEEEACPNSVPTMSEEIGNANSADSPRRPNASATAAVNSAVEPTPPTLDKEKTCVASARQSMLREQEDSQKENQLLSEFILLSSGDGFLAPGDKSIAIAFFLGGGLGLLRARELAKWLYDEKQEAREGEEQIR